MLLTNMTRLRALFSFFTYASSSTGTCWFSDILFRSEGRQSPIQNNSYWFWADGFVRYWQVMKWVQQLLNTEVSHGPIHNPCKDKIGQDIQSLMITKIYNWKYKTKTLMNCFLVYKLLKKADLPSATVSMCCRSSIWLCLKSKKTLLWNILSANQ